MSAQSLFNTLVDQLWALVAAEADRLAGELRDPLQALQPLADAGHPSLQGRLLDPLSPPPQGAALLDLLHHALGDLPEGGPVRWHGWERTAGDPRGIALVATDGPHRAVLALSPAPGGGPVVDLVVTPGATVKPPPLTSPPPPAAPQWTVTVEVRSTDAWEASWRPGQAQVLLGSPGTAEIKVVRDGLVTVGPAQGPGVSWTKVELGIAYAPGAPPATTVDLTGFRIRILPPELRSLLGAAGTAAETAAAELRLLADRVQGLRFGTGTLRIPVPGRLELPGADLHDLAVELREEGGRLLLRPAASLSASVPGLPLHLQVDGLAVTLPLDLDGPTVHLDPGKVGAAVPAGFGVDLRLPPVSGGGLVTRQPDGQYAGLLDLDLGVVKVQAMGLLALPAGDDPLSFLVLLTAGFPPPGIQLGFGFALDAVGGLVGINRRVDDGALRQLVSDGNADRIMFPDHAAERAREILGSLDDSFPVARGHHVVGPMLQLNWGGRIVRFSVAVILEVPDPVRVIILGRVEIGIPDPDLPLIHLQAAVLGRIEPAIPLVEILVSLAGSHVAGIPITGEVYALFRGGSDPTFVLSAGGFHPRYTRPAGVPELRRLAMDIGGGFFGLRAEAYFALTSNSLQFGGLVHLDQTIAGCGVQGHLGLDALFVWEPRVAFSVQVQAGVAVLAFGRRLASVSLRFTLEGPGAWHAFGTGSISILWWDVDLDFDVRWGTPPALTGRAPDIVEEVRRAVARAEAWALAPPTDARSPIRLARWAAADLAAGKVALPESGLQILQDVVPLDREFNRFHRSSVPPQTWRLGAVHLDTDRQVTPGTPLESRFVPGELWAMEEEEQLTRAGFESLPAGAVLSAVDVIAGSQQPADETYETAYEVDAGWFPPAPTPWPRFVLSPSTYLVEVYARRLPVAERVEVWRREQQRVPDIAVTLGEVLL